MVRYGSFAALAALGWAALVLAGCSSGPTSFEETQKTCPRVISVPETQTIALFGPTGHEAKDVMVAGRIRGIDYQCVPAKVGLDVRAEISFEAQRANLDIADANLPYFVALVDSNEQVLSEQGFTLVMKFLPGEAYRRMPVEKITVHLPVKEKSAGSNYTVVVGFQLTPEQIAFNRAAQSQ